MNDLPAFNGARILLLEDEPLVSMALEDALLDLDCTVLGPFLHLEDAIAYVHGHAHGHAGGIDLGILDINIRGERSFALAELLLQRDIPFIFSTGYDEAGIDWRWRGWPNLGKLFTRVRLADMIGQQLKRHTVTAPG